MRLKKTISTSVLIVQLPLEGQCNFVLSSFMAEEDCHFNFCLPANNITISEQTVKLCPMISIANPNQQKYTYESG